MIKILAFNNKEIYINPDLIEKIEITPDTVITLTNGKLYVVKDTPEEIIRKVTEFKRNILSGCFDVRIKE